MTRYPTPERRPWDVDTDTSKAALERLARALIETDSTLTCSMTLGRHALGRGITAFLRVHIPEGREEAFDAACRPIFRRPPSRLSVGMEVLP